jgi:hypothetical protein
VIERESSHEVKDSKESAVPLTALMLQQALNHVEPDVVGIELTCVERSGVHEPHTQVSVEEKSGVTGRIRSLGGQIYSSLAHLFLRALHERQTSA